MGYLAEVLPQALTPKTWKPKNSFEEMVKRYQEYEAKSVENLLKKARTLFDAKRTLDEKTFGDFCSRVHLEPTSSRCRKLLKIGEQADRFFPLVQKLPNAWTTIYDLSALAGDVFNEIVEEDLLSPSVTARAIREFTQSPTDNRKKPRASAKSHSVTKLKGDTNLKDAASGCPAPVLQEPRTDFDLGSYEIRLDLGELDDDGRRLVLSGIEMLRKDHPFGLWVSPDLKNNYRH